MECLVTVLMSSGVHGLSYIIYIFVKVSGSVFLCIFLYIKLHIDFNLFLVLFLIEIFAKELLYPFMKEKHSLNFYHETGPFLLE